MKVEKRKKKRNERRNNDRKIEKCTFDILIGNTSENDPFPIMLLECQAYIQEDVFYYKDLVDCIQREEDRQWDSWVDTPKPKI